MDRRPTGLSYYLNHFHQVTFVSFQADVVKTILRDVTMLAAQGHLTLVSKVRRTTGKVIVTAPGKEEMVALGLEAQTFQLRQIT